MIRVCAARVLVKVLRLFLRAGERAKVNMAKKEKRRRKVEDKSWRKRRGYVV
jgi:hypothetical protein